MLSNRLFYEPLVQWVLVAGSITFLRQLIEQKIDLSTRGSSGETLLFLVCLQDSQEAAQILVENGAEIDVEIQNGWTLLHAAAHNQSPATLRYLLKLGLDPNVVSNGNMTPLHCAAQYGTTQHIELLLDNGAIQASLDNINSQTRSGLSPLMIASKSGSLSSVKWALEMGADCCAVDSMGRTALHAAASNSSVDSVSIIKILIAKGLSVADTDDAGSSPLHCVLYTPAWDDDEDEDEDEDENDEEESPFDPIYARANAQALIQYGANVNAQDGSGNTLLHFAAWKGHKYMVKMLLKEGADKNIEDVQGKKPIDLAREDDIRELLEPF
ncbi:ankyrin [Lojkania enalia]|uniref:Ankyrin n=1 Tax=Lojkania enalia TaxID=147567 RepID=A0A9P4KHD5_9PLEO|nr:ankyrin [Didymosphaeria enalia]